MAALGERRERGVPISVPRFLSRARFLFLFLPDCYFSLCTCFYCSFVSDLPHGFFRRFWCGASRRIPGGQVFQVGGARAIWLCRREQRAPRFWRQVFVFFAFFVFFSFCVPFVMLRIFFYMGRRTIYLLCA